jgi:hypothetical protein
VPKSMAMASLLNVYVPPCLEPVSFSKPHAPRIVLDLSFRGLSSRDPLTLQDDVTNIFTASILYQLFILILIPCFATRSILGHTLII